MVASLFIIVFLLPLNPYWFNFEFQIDVISSYHCFFFNSFIPHKSVSSVQTLAFSIKIGKLTTKYLTYASIYSLVNVLMSFKFYFNTLVCVSSFVLRQSLFHKLSSLFLHLIHLQNETTLPICLPLSFLSVLLKSAIVYHFALKCSLCRERQKSFWCVLSRFFFRIYILAVFP